MRRGNRKEKVMSEKTGGNGEGQTLTNIYIFVHISTQVQYIRSHRHAPVSDLTTLGLALASPSMVGQIPCSSLHSMISIFVFLMSYELLRVFT